MYSLAFSISTRASVRLIFRSIYPFVFDCIEHSTILIMNSIFNVLKCFIIISGRLRFSNSRTTSSWSLLFACRLVFLCYHIQARMNEYDLSGMGELQGIVSSEENPLFPPKYRRASLRYYPHVVYRRASLKPIIGRHGQIFFNKKGS